MDESKAAPSTTDGPKVEGVGAAMDTTPDDPVVKVVPVHVAAALAWTKLYVGVRAGWPRRP